MLSSRVTNDADALTRQIAEFRQHLVRDRCVNDGTVASGREVRTTDVLRACLGGSGLDLEVNEPEDAPGCAALVARSDAPIFRTATWPA